MDNTGVACKCGCDRLVKLRSDGVQASYIKGHKIGKPGTVNVPVKTKCGFCDKGIIVEKWRLDRNGVAYCDRRCFGFASSKRALVTFACETCGKSFTVKGSRKQGGHVFCSTACAKARTRNSRKVAVRCAHCQADLLVYPNKFKTNAKFYCNPECRANHIKGENNPSYINGESVGRGRHGEYGPNWRRQTRKAKMRDGNRCALCHAAKDKPKFLHVHHRVEILEFNGAFEKGNDLTNLITLCEVCHHRLHKGDMSLLP